MPWSLVGCTGEVFARTIGGEYAEESEDIPWLTINTSLTLSGDSGSSPP